MNTLVKNHLHSRANINGIPCDWEGLEQLISSFAESKESYLQKTADFLTQWLAPQETITLHTSGTTGIPKQIKLKKQSMVNSALATGDYLKLSPKNRALLCLPADFIAGKMMIIRSIILGLHLDIIRPSSMPLSLTSKNYDFCAMIPLQASKSLVDLPRVKKVILGGASIDGELEAKLQTISTEVYSSYGMTETISHIAMRKVNHTEVHQNTYKALPNVTFTQDERHCLVIDAPLIADHPVVTNDIVNLISRTEFEWLGRFDNIINSGGFKVFPESVERKIKKYIKEDYFITKEADEELGQRAVLYVQGDEKDYPTLSHDIYMDKDMLKYEVPRQIYFVPEFVYTDNQKIRRDETVKKYKQ